MIVLGAGVLIIVDALEGDAAHVGGGRKVEGKPILAGEVPLQIDQCALAGPPVAVADDQLQVENDVFSIVTVPDQLEDTIRADLRFRRPGTGEQ
ncbi:hypothetical protein [Candidatus Thiosymbion oneisti]|uniref:hypothetical protein n=1 Tax=Candidatus Thiosymbion oneisti TaxID=589554 RepID=UPI0013FD6C12|nr:hypothetical protein [Candidatus Thiosymbion oneisti]